MTAAGLAHGHWSRLPNAPIPDRNRPAGVWTGRELLVWGGESGRDGAVLHADGAAYDPARNAWRRLAPSPRPRGPLFNQHLVWTGSRLLAWTDWEQVARSTVTLAGGRHGIREVGNNGIDVWAYDPPRITGACCRRRGDSRRWVAR